MKTKYKLAFAAILATGVLLAQADKPATPAAEPEYFRLNFVVKEVEHGKVVNSRDYSLVTLASGKDRSSIRAGTRTPIPAGPPEARQFQYVDVGVNIDCNSAQRLQNTLAMYVSAELSTMAPLQEKAVTLAPSIRQNKWNSAVVLIIGKPTVLFSSDDLTSPRTLQLEVTATPVK